MMAVSGSYDYGQNRDSLLKDALVTAKVVRDDETPTGTMMSSAARLCNRMIKSWTTDGLQLWRHKHCIVFLEDGKRDYQLYSSGDRWIVQEDAVETKLNGALSASDTAVTVDTTTGMTASDIIGIVTASNTIHWDTIASVDTSTTLTLTTGVAAAAADDAYVVAYTNKAQKPYRIIDGYVIRYAQDDVHIPVNIYSDQEFMRLPPGLSEASPITVRFIPDRTMGRLQVWPTPDADNHRLILRAHLPFSDMDSSTDDFEFPDYWLDALHYNMAYRLHIDYGTRLDGDVYNTHGKSLEKMAEKSFLEASNFDVENTYIQLEPGEYIRYDGYR